MKQASFLLCVLLASLAAACGGEPAANAPAETPLETPDPALLESEAHERAALASCGAVTAEGYCGIQLGATPEVAAVAFPVKLENYDVAPPADVDPLRCFELFAIEPVTGISLLVEGGAVRRIDFISGTARTADGLGVGSAAATIRAKFGATVSETQNAIEPEITNIGVMQGETKFVFEMENDVVRSWRVGLAPAIDYPAHCG
jgi:hypothetical protein